MDVFDRQSKALEQGILAKPDADMSHAYRASIFTCQVVGVGNSTLHKCTWNIVLQRIHPSHLRHNISLHRNTLKEGRPRLLERGIP